MVFLVRTGLPIFALLASACIPTDVVEAAKQEVAKRQPESLQYVDVDQVVEGGAGYFGRELGVRGTVVAGSLRQELGSREYELELEHRARKLPVIYQGVLPEYLGDGVEVIARGQLVPGPQFRARELIVKCPDSYEAQP